MLVSPLAPVELPLLLLLLLLPRTPLLMSQPMLLLLIKPPVPRFLLPRFTAGASRL